MNKFNLKEWHQKSKLTLEQGSQLLGIHYSLYEIYVKKNEEIELDIHTIHKANEYLKSREEEKKKISETLEVSPHKVRELLYALNDEKNHYFWPCPDLSHLDKEVKKGFSCVIQGICELNFEVKESFKKNKFQPVEKTSFQRMNKFCMIDYYPLNSQGNSWTQHEWNEYNLNNFSDKKRILRSLGIAYIASPSFDSIVYFFKSEID